VFRLMGFRDGVCGSGSESWSELASTTGVIMMQNESGL
jgi:hypothetical protein